jgi:hypothetical protein
MVYLYGARRRSSQREQSLLVNRNLPRRAGHIAVLFRAMNCYWLITEILNFSISRKQREKHR